MRKTAATAALLALSLGMSGCATKSAPYTPNACPAIPPLPASLATPLNAERRLSETLLESAPSATQGSEP